MEYFELDQREISKIVSGYLQRESARVPDGRHNIAVRGDDGTPYYALQYGSDILAVYQLTNRGWRIMQFPDVPPEVLRALEELG